MHRFYLTDPKIKNNILHFQGPEWRHANTVLRSKKGERLTLFDGKGTEYLTEIESCSSQEGLLKILSRTSFPPPPYSITLAQAMPKHKVMDWIVQKATELGVYEIIPVISERSVVRSDSENPEHKLKRWREICIESAKQCGLNWLPRLAPPKTVKEVVRERSSYSQAWIASLQPDARPLWHYSLGTSSPAEKHIIMIGPEGDFTPAEYGLARGSHFQPLSLGPLVLRCDTAAVYTLSTLSYELRKNLSQPS